MSRVKNKNTAPEIYLRKLLWKKGFRYRLNYKELPGRPDIYCNSYKTAIFVNGCFWHMHAGCKLATIPKSNHVFWKEKLQRNVERDRQTYMMLEQKGIKVIVIWGCVIQKMIKNRIIEERILRQLTESIESTDITIHEIEDVE